MSAVFGGIFFSGINITVTGILKVKDEGSFNQGLIERLANRSNYLEVDPGKRGLAMKEAEIRFGE